MSAVKKTPRKMGRPTGRAFEQALHLRVDDDTLERLDALAERVAATGLGRSALARLCLRIGLDLAERDVRALLADSQPKRKTTK